MKIDPEVLKEAKAIFYKAIVARNREDGAEAGPDALTLALEHVWEAAHAEGVRTGFDDGWDEGVKEGGCDYCRT